MPKILSENIQGPNAKAASAKGRAIIIQPRIPEVNESQEKPKINP
jgi:hypothetical protein